MHAITNIITSLIASAGYAGVFFWMLLESACIPVPSEAIMPFASAMIVTRHMFNLHALAFVGAFGNLAGSALAYWVGAAKGRDFVEKYGKFILIRHKDVETADRWFTNYGEATVFFSRMLPIIRTFISLPAGISRMNFGRFCLYTFIGALPWCYLLTWAGLKLGQNWEQFGAYAHKADAVLGVVLIVLIAVFIWKHVKPDEPQRGEQR